MKILTVTEIQAVSGTGTIADTLANTASSYGAALEKFLHGADYSTICSAFVKGVGSAVEAGLGIVSSVINGVSNIVSQVVSLLIKVISNPAATIVGTDIGATGITAGNIIVGCLKNGINNF